MQPAPVIWSFRWTKKPYRVRPTGDRGRADTWGSFCKVRRISDITGGSSAGCKQGFSMYAGLGIGGRGNGIGCWVGMPTIPPYMNVRRESGVVRYNVTGAHKRRHTGLINVWSINSPQREQRNARHDGRAMTSRVVGRITDPVRLPPFPFVRLRGASIPPLQPAAAFPCSFQTSHRVWRSDPSCPVL